MTSATLRKIWIQLHRWIGLSLGSLLLVSGLTGVALMLLEPVDEALRPELFQAGQPGNGRLDPILGSLRSEFGANASFTIRTPREPGETVHVFVSGPWSGTVFFDPHSRQERGRLARDEGFFNVLFNLHSTLMSTDVGRPVLALSALAYVVLLVSGLVLWWPKSWKKALSVHWRFGTTRALFDLHRWAGVVVGTVIAVSIATGAYMAWRPLSQSVSFLWGSEQVLPPTLDAPTGSGTSQVDAAVAKALELVPDGRIGYVQVPPQGTQALRIRLITPADPHPNGLTSVWLHPESHEVLALHSWTELDTGTRAYAWIYPLHTGELFGRITWTASLLSGVGLIFSGFTGFWLWWRRRQGVK